MLDESDDLSFHEDEERYIPTPQKRGELKFYNSHEEQEEDRSREMSKFSGLENLINLRRLINISYGMHGYDPNKPTGLHNLIFTERERF
jgi:hypothetical protein